MEKRTPVQRLVDAMLDGVESTNLGVEYVIWMPLLESLLLPRDTTYGPRSSPRSVHRYRAYRVQPLDTPVLIVWVCPAAGLTKRAGAPSYIGDLLTERITTHK